MNKNRFVLNDEKPVYVTEWISEKPDNILVIVHGMYDHAELYDSLCEHLTQNGITCIAFDLVGHGNGYADSLGKGGDGCAERIVCDIKSVLAYALTKGLPVTVLGFGFGCNVILANDGIADGASKLIFASPLFLGKKFGLINKLTKLRTFNSQKPAKAITKVVFGGFDKHFREGINAWMCSDKVLTGELNCDKLFYITYTYSWYKSFKKIMRFTKGNSLNANKYNKQFLVLCGAADPSIKRAYFSDISENTKVLKNSRHKIFLDADKEKAADCVLQFVKEKTIT